jgi:GntR family transcriptional regulator, transcriptional repressor for pyruvate dehydrogenase complex
MFNAVRFNKASQQIISQIRGLILEGKLSPGDRLPSESALTDQFQVSKQTLREALRALEYMGLLEIRKGVTGGAYVVEVDPGVAKEILTNFLYFKNLTIRNLSEIRKIIEPYAAQVAARRMEDKDVDRLAALLEASKKEPAEEYSTDMSVVDLDFHRVIAKSTDNPILVLMVDFVESLMGDLKKLVRPDAGFSVAVLKAHERIYSAIKSRDEGKAASEMYDHVAEVEERLARLEEKVALWRRAR